MKKKKTVLLLFFAVLTFALCGCNSETNNIIMPGESSEHIQSSYGTTEVDSSNASDDNEIEYDFYISSGKPYMQGEFTTTEYFSEWLGLYCDIPIDMRLDEDYIKTIKELNQYYGEDSLREMKAINSDETKSVDIYVNRLPDNQTFEQYVKQYFKEVRDSLKQYSVNGNQLSDSGDNFSTYSFMGENYLLNSYLSEARYNGKLTRATNWWNLFRVKEDRVIHIQCMAHQNSGVELENLLSMFTTYEDHFNSGTTSNDESNTSSGNNFTNSNVSGYNSGNDNSGNTSINPCANGHTWEAVTKTVHYDEVGHYELVVVEAGYTWYCCPMCGDEFKSKNSYYSHFDSTHSDTIFLREGYTHGTVADQYDEIWVVDKEAYDATVITDYKCSICGVVKP